MKILLVIFSFFLVACAPYSHRGSFSVLSTEKTASTFEVLSSVKVSGEACFDILKTAAFMDENVFELATRNAVSEVEGATALLDAVFIDNGPCVVATGYPAK